MIARNSPLQFRLAWSGLLIALLFCFTNTTAQVLRTGDFESGDLSGFGLQGAFPDSLTVVPDPVRDGSWAGKSYLRSSDPDVSGGNRAEFVDNTISPLHEVRWYGLSIYAGDDFTVPQGTDGVVFQFHQQASTGSPVLAFRLIRNIWRITSNTDLDGPRRTFTTVPFESGVWTDWVVRVRWSEQATGELTIWKNDQLVFHETDLQTTYASEQTGPYVKFGQYHSVEDVPENTLYFDSYVMAGPASSYEDVAPSGQTPDKQPQLDRARVVNLSTRTIVGGNAGTPVVGMVIGGTGQKTVLVRAIGPALTSFQVDGPMADPRLDFVRPIHGLVVATNDDWSSAENASLLASTSERLGAFPLPAGSADSAWLGELPAAVYTVHVPEDRGEGVVLLELYDAGSARDEATLINVSTRAHVGQGDQSLVSGFVVAGEGTRRFLIRAIGPTLLDYGVTAALANPVLTLFSDLDTLATNDDWGDNNNAAEIGAAANLAGAFALATDSHDAALLVDLPAGVYTAQVGSPDHGAGTALLEIYLID